MRELRMLAVAIVLVLAVPAAAQAATFTVDRLDDAHDANTADGVCDVASDGCTLRAAVEQADVTAGADQINLRSGTIVLDGSLGSLFVDESLTVVGTGIDTSIIDGTDVGDATFFADGSTDSLVLQDLSITGDTSDVGEAVVDSYAPSTTLRRAAIFDSAGPTILGAWPEEDNGVLTLDGARFYGNQAAYDVIDAGPGGNGTVTITNTTINGNQVSHADHRSAIVRVDPAGDSDVSIAGSTFSKNGISGTGGSDGVVFINPRQGSDVATTLRISDSAFLANRLGDDGFGALQIRPTSFGGHGPVDAAIARSRFEDNVAGLHGTGDGGAIGFYPNDEYSNATKSLTITDSSFLRNTAGAGGSGHGGAIDWQPESGISTLTIDGSTFAANHAGPSDDTESADSGGAIDFDNGTFVARNSTFSGNHVQHGWFDRSGGAIAFGNVLDAQLTHVTMVGNSATRGAAGGISVQPLITAAGVAQAVQPSTDLTVTNSIVAGNTSEQAEPQSPQGVRAQAATAPADCSRPVTSGGGNIEGDTTCGFTGTGDRQSTDPRVAALAGNGGPTQTHAIGKDSPAFDRALASACLPKDQRGVTRPQFTGCDVGAYELAPSPPPAVVPAPATGGVQGSTAHQCVSRRSFRIRIRVPRAAKVDRALVLVNGRLAAVRRGSRLTAAIHLRGLPKGRFDVKIVLWLSNGRKTSGTRRYHTCHPAIPPKRIPKL